MKYCKGCYHYVVESEYKCSYGEVEVIQDTERGMVKFFRLNPQSNHLTLGCPKFKEAVLPNQICIPIITPILKYLGILPLKSNVRHEILKGDVELLSPGGEHLYKGSDPRWD